MSKVIGVDLDEVLGELLDYCLYYHDYKINGIKVDREKVKDYYIHHMVEYDITRKEGIEWFRKAMNYDSKLEIKPVIGAKEGLDKLKLKGYKLKIVTARPGDLYGEYTKKWVEKHFPNYFEEIVFVNTSTIGERKKSDLCKDNGILHMVEDNFDYALELAENGVITYLIEKPWNKEKHSDNKNLIRVKSWEEIDF